MAATQYLDSAGLLRYDVNLKKYIDERDIVIEVLETPQTGAAVSYEVSTWEVTVDKSTNTSTKVKKHLSYINIPEGATLLSGSVGKATFGEGDAAAEKDALIFKVGVDAEHATDVTVDISEITSRLDTLEGDKTVTGSVDNKIYNQAADAKYGEADAYKDADGNVISKEAYEALPDKTGYTATKVDVSLKDAIEAAAESANIKITKLASAEDGNFATYALADKDGNVIAGSDKINIPKDFLVKSGSVFKATADDVTNDTSGILVENELFLDFVVNAKDATDGTGAEHVYIPVNALVDVYTVDETTTTEIQLTIDENNKITAEIVDGSISRDKIDTDFEGDLTAIETAIGKKTVTGDDGSNTEVLVNVADRIKAEAKDATYKAATETEAEVTIAQAIKALEDASSDTNGAIVYKGALSGEGAALPVDAKKGDAYTFEGKLYVCTVTGTPETVPTFVDIAIDEDGLDAILGTGYTIGDADPVAVTVKKYIDSRIFIGTAQQIADAKAAKEIDSTTFTIEVDEGADAFEPIGDDYIDGLFA